MQKQQTVQSYPVENASFVEFFRDNRWKIHMDYHMPPLHPIEAIHHHDAMELGFCMEGSGVFWIDGAQYPFHGPCASLIYPGQLHKACSTGDTPSRWAFITFQLRQENLVGDYRAWGYEGGVFSDGRLLKLVEEVVYECERKQPQFERCARGLLETIVLRYERDCAARFPRERVQERFLLERLRPVMQYIAGHYQEPITVQTLSDLLFVHESTLRGWFQRAVGMSPMEYVHHTRITTACSLLRDTSVPISRIAEDVGYQSISSFNRQFEAICGCSPRAYRRNL